MGQGILFAGGRVFTGGRLVPCEVLVRDGRIAAVGTDLERTGCQVVELEGNILSPGFLDVHTHGGAGVDINAAGQADLEKLSAFFASQGVTGFLASILTDTVEATERAIDHVCTFMDGPAPGARCLGIHLEGPFLCLKYKGAMPPELLREGDAGLFLRYQERAGGRVRYMTVAPEVKGVPEMISQLRGACVLAMGHTDADYETAIDAIERGVTACTHTFNVMSLFHQHRPAVMGAVLEKPVYCEAICDGRHLHPGTVRMLLSCKGWDKVVAITDSMQAAGLPDGEYMLGINPVTVTDGDAKISGTDIRAGSTLTLAQAVKNLSRFTGEGPEKVLGLLTTNPARLIGEDHRRGDIAVGKDADFVVLSSGLDVIETWSAGKKVYAAAHQ
ncbi:N-acetylglucosamine-6-phosphate deacetylase [uncultured Intestinimonas sp.]|uniref:N-acetylglucosamine-6-phosphate deacetylase n=1 Tax=uncultured Intestinimonas sp. TaxID=1689265 RepID=UPI0025F6548F|nr:N-acetylglucosamine-6-phosphate deacetylase [uncultured Intestinimonas sp.]